MPPRISSRHILSSNSCQCLHSARQSLPHDTSIPSQSSRPFHSSQSSLLRNKKATALRRDFFEWLNSAGKAFRDPLEGSTNYLGAYDRRGNLLRTREVNGRDQRRGDDTKAEEKIQRQEQEEGLDEAERAARAQLRARERGNRNAIPQERASDLRPYPLNSQFRSQSVLSEELREELYRQIAVRKVDVATVSAAYGVDIRRVAAVVRLKTVEKQWQEEGKTLAKPYNNAVMAMLPKTPYSPSGRITTHEGINDLPVHPATRQQIFYPASESRQFNREDAAKVFSPTLLPADERIPHPELIQLEKWSIEELPREERLTRMREADEKSRTMKEKKERKHQEWEARTQRVVPGRRWDFKFQDISVESVGRDGRSKEGVGYRYGMPHEDRKRGQVKIPASVE